MLNILFSSVLSPGDVANAPLEVGFRICLDERVDRANPTPRAVGTGGCALIRKQLILKHILEKSFYT